MNITYECLFEHRDGRDGRDGRGRMRRPDLSGGVVVVFKLSIC